MAFDSDIPLFSADDFDHKTSLVTLEDLVMFPRLMAACCISKRSQIDLVEAAIQTNHLISIGVASIPVDVACLCRILAMQRDSEGRLHLVLMGLHRVRVGVPVALNEQRGVRPAEICDEDDPPAADPEELDHLRRVIGGVARGLFVAGGVPTEMTDQLNALMTHRSVSLGNICDLLASMFELDAEEKGIVLMEVDVVRRAHSLIASLAKLAIKHQITQFIERQSDRAIEPPSFSLN